MKPQNGRQRVKASGWRRQQRTRKHSPNNSNNNGKCRQFAPTKINVAVVGTVAPALMKPPLLPPSWRSHRSQSSPLHYSYQCALLGPSHRSKRIGRSSGHASNKRRLRLQIAPIRSDRIGSNRIATCARAVMNQAIRSHSANSCSKVSQLGGGKHTNDRASEQTNYCIATLCSLSLSLIIAVVIG